MLPAVMVVAWPNAHAGSSMPNSSLACRAAYFLTFPRFQDTPHRFECTRLIAAEQVKVVSRTMPGFGTST
jgi:hypothetical protein